MLVNLGGDCYWEVTPITGNQRNKAILRSSKTCDTKRAMTISMLDYDAWLWNNLERLEGNTDCQNKIIFCMDKWGQHNYFIEREGKVIFS